jgi:hypothetical protein
MEELESGAAAVCRKISTAGAAEPFKARSFSIIT